MRDPHFNEFDGAGDAGGISETFKAAAVFLTLFYGERMATTSEFIALKLRIERVSIQLLRSSGRRTKSFCMSCVLISHLRIEGYMISYGLNCR